MSVLESALLLGAQPVPEEPVLTFFITSARSGNSADLGGLEGADRICQALADAVGAEGVQWHAYLSTLPANGKPGVDARDRDRRGAWYNAKGTKVVDNVADLRSDNNKLNKENSLTEKGAVVNGRGDTPNMHDILTGSNLDGTAFGGEGYNICDNWTGQGRECASRAPRPAGRGGESHLMELGAQLPRMRPGEPYRHRWEWLLLLFRDNALRDCRSPLVK